MSDMSDINDENEFVGGTLTEVLIDVVLTEHNMRRTSIMEILQNLEEKIKNSDDEIEENLSIEHFNDVIESSVKNDGNIVKMIELLLKYKHEASNEQIEKVKEYKTKLSSNRLNLKFEDE